MKVNDIRRLVQQRPFKPLVFHLDNGERQIANHPEIIVTEMMIVLVDDYGQLIYLVPEAVSAVRYAQSSYSRRAQIHKTKTLNSCNQYWPHICLLPLSDLMFRSI